MTDIARVVGPTQWLEATASSATCTVTVPPSPDFPRLYLVGYDISASAAPGAAVVATITGLAAPGGGVQTKHINIPASAFMPSGNLFGALPLLAAPGQPLVFSVPSLTAVCTATLYFRYGP